MARYDTGRKGRTLQYNGHLDTVHLPFVPPRVDNGMLYGSGCSDMKGGIATAVEAMLALRETGLLSAGEVLLTAHDLHETPWGDGTQVNSLIDQGHVGDGVLPPEYLSDRLPVCGRGLAILEVAVERSGVPGRESVFVGQVVAGEIFNQSPIELRLSGTRRWLPGTPIADVQQQYLDLLSEVGRTHGVDVQDGFQVARDAFELDQQHPLTHAFQAAYAATTGVKLPVGEKPFVDDGNEFVRRGGVPAITHGPNAKGAHTLHEEVPINELVRMAVVYALTAVGFCQSD